MALFIEWPWLALVPAAAFWALHRASRRRPAAVAAGLWLLYALYEQGMRSRLLCSGECNIRVDLLLIYPLLLAVSILGLVAALRALRRRGTD